MYMHEHQSVYFRETTEMHPWTAPILLDIQIKSRRLFDHLLEVGAMSFNIGSSLGLNRRLLGQAYLYGLLHDIGKSGELLALVNFTGRFNDQQRLQMQQHPTIGYEMLSTIAAEHTNIPDKKLIQRAAIVVGGHHTLQRQPYPVGFRRFTPQEQNSGLPTLLSVAAIADYVVARSTRSDTGLPPVSTKNAFESARNCLQLVF